VNQIGRQLRKAINLIVAEAIFDRQVLAFDKARVLQALSECAPAVRKRLGRSRIEEPDHRHRRLLRARASPPATLPRHPAPR
jgi:hypothetical protein